MATCCARLGKVYMIITNLLFVCVGIGFIAFGLIGKRNGFNGATLFPEDTFQYMIVLGVVALVAAVIGVIAAYIRRKFVIYLYMMVTVIAMVIQVVIGVKVYQKASNVNQYLAPLWTAGSINFRANLETEFSCCGFQTSTDNYAVTDQCNPTVSTVNLSPCASILQHYLKDTLSKVYLAVFAALAMELLALSNAITMLCTRDKDEEERRKQRKSGIRLDDMSVETPVSSTFPPSTREQKGHYNNDPNNGNRYDSYDMYRHNNHSNAYSDNYSNRPGAYY
ncbi:hypothetical protein K501DRAFT_236587, partial [Backusella circina FSU 941]